VCNHLQYWSVRLHERLNRRSSDENPSAVVESYTSIHIIILNALTLRAPGCFLALEQIVRGLQARIPHRIGFMRLQVVVHKSLVHACINPVELTMHPSFPASICCSQHPELSSHLQDVRNNLPGLFNTSRSNISDSSFQCSALKSSSIRCVVRYCGVHFLCANAFLRYTRTEHPCSLDSDTEDAETPPNPAPPFARGIGTDLEKGRNHDSLMFECFFQSSNMSYYSQLSA
jgi:hypothetical protein